jgi:hypothetical protein
MSAYVLRPVRVGGWEPRWSASRVLRRTSASLFAAFLGGCASFSGDGGMDYVRVALWLHFSNAL